MIRIPSADPGNHSQIRPINTTGTSAYRWVSCESGKTVCSHNRTTEASLIAGLNSRSYKNEVSPTDYRLRPFPRSFSIEVSRKSAWISSPVPDKIILILSFPYLPWERGHVRRDGCRRGAVIDRIRKASSRDLNSYFAAQAKELRCCRKHTTSLTPITASPYN
jgi:hypothetical protein